MRTKSKLLFGMIFLALSLILGWATVWHVNDTGHFRPGSHDWQTASAGDCEAMARSLQAFKFAGGLKPPPLIGNTPGSGPCNWSTYGLHLRTLTVDAFRAAYEERKRQGRGFEVIQVSQPWYSWLHVRAAVKVDHYYGDLGADGFNCHLVLGLQGWRLQECRKVWVS